MAELDLAVLEQAAREAGGGGWFSTGWTVGSRGFEVGDLKSRDRICSDATERCAEFIAAANPATILELLGRLKAAEKERDALRADKATLQQMMYSLKDCLEVAEKERDFAKTEIACLHDDIRELTDERVLDEEDRERIVAWRQGTSTKPVPSVPREAIEKMLTQLMDIAVSNGANSVSMPDEYVEVAAWLCGIPAHPARRVPDAVMAALDNLDDYISRIEGNDRGACDHINLLRRYLLDATEVGENE